MNYNFLTSKLFGECKGLVEIRAFHKTTNKSAQIFTTNGKQINDWVTERKEEYNIYYGVCTRQVDATSGKKTDCYEIIAYWADLDFRKYPGGESEARERLSEFLFTPTYTVNSGNGLHPYWVFKEPVIIANSIDLHEKRLKGIEHNLNSDHVSDISRILRVPGTVNHPTKSKIAAGIIEPKQCELESESDVYYEPADFDLFVDSRSKNNDILETKSEFNLLHKLEKDLIKYPKLNLTWIGNRPDLKDSSRSGFDMALATLLAQLHYSKQEISEILKKYQYGKFNDGSEAYFNYTIDKALKTSHTHKVEQKNIEIVPEIIPVIIKPWPKIRPEAFHGISGQVVDLISPNSEADNVAILINFITCFTNSLNRNSYFHVGDDRHYMNMFFVLVGDSSVGRKGTSFKPIKRIMELVDPDWTKTRIKNGLASGEGLINEVRDDLWEDKYNKASKKRERQLVVSGILDKRLLINQEEFAQTLKVMQRETNTLSAIIRSCWDGTSLHNLAKTSPLTATDPMVSIISHITTSELKKFLNETEQANGFGNRFNYACVRRSKCLSNPKAMDDSSLTSLLSLISQLKAISDYDKKNVGAFQRSKEAQQLWDDLYKTLSSEKRGIIGILCARKAAQVIRISCAYAILDKSKIISPTHINAALALVDYCEESIKYIYGDSLGDSISDRIIQELDSIFPNSLSETEIHNLFNRHNSSRIRHALNDLHSYGILQKLSIQTNGRPKINWCMAKKANEAKKVFAEDGVS